MIEELVIPSVQVISCDWCVTTDKCHVSCIADSID